MKIIEATFYETFPIPANERWQKIVLKASLNDTDDERQVLYTLKKKVEDFFFESNKAAEKELEKATTSSITKVATIIEQINTCTELTVLESYRLMVKGNISLQNAYDNKYSELTKDLKPSI